MQQPALDKLGLKTCVLESTLVGKHAKTYADNDKMAAARVALVSLAGNAPCVWVPDEQSRERRELLHAYRKAVGDHTAATNSIKAYLNGHGIRLGKRSLEEKGTPAWILEQRNWSVLQKNILEEHLANIAESKERRKRLYRLIAAEMAADPTMMRCMKVLGVGIVSAFALLAIIGDIRNLLIQGAQAILRTGHHTVLGQWGWKLFARKGSRNVAVAAVARKLVVQVWHMLQGNPPTALETDKSFRLKLHKLAVVLGTALRRKADLGQSLSDCVNALLQRCINDAQPVPA